jgi:magnesium transporter
MTRQSDSKHSLTALLNIRRRDGLRRARTIGASPLAIEPPERTSDTTVTWLVYGPDAYSESTVQPEATGDDLLWIDVCGLRDHSRVAEIARSRGLSDLAIADLFHLDQRAHTDIADELTVTVLKMPVAGPPFKADQITLILGSNFVLSVREAPRDCFDTVRKRLATGNGRIRGSSAYLFYALIDAVVEAYFPILEHYGDMLEILEEQVLANPGNDAMANIHLLKRELLDLRHAIWPMREALAALQHDDTPHIDEPLLPYLRDCSDHAFQLLDMVEVYRETAQGLVDLQLSSLSNRMNEVMKVLTMIATIFIPMTFVAGVYGMNFDRASPYNLPELGWKFGYLYALGLMVGSASIMLAIFWRLGWIFRRTGGVHTSNRSGKNPN